MRVFRELSVAPALQVLLHHRGRGHRSSGSSLQDPVVSRLAFRTGF